LCILNLNFLINMKNMIYFFLSLCMCIGMGWHSTFAQPQYVSDIPVNSSNFISAFDNVYFFSGNDLWGSDGTPEGTLKLKSLGEQPVEYWIGPTFNDRRKPNLALGDAYFFFSTLDAGNNYSLWASDGTEDGTVKLASGKQAIEPLAELGSDFYFLIKDAEFGAEMYKVDMALNLSLVSDINPGTASAFEINNLAYLNVHHIRSKAEVYDNALFFVAEDPLGNALWKYTGTTLVLIERLPEGKQPYEMQVVENVLFFNYTFTNYMFSGIYPGEVTQLWKTDGTSSGTLLVKNIHFRDIEPATPDSEEFLYHFTAYQGKLYFAHGTTFRSDFWVSDGTAAGTTVVAETVTLDGMVARIGAVNNRIYIAAMGQGDAWRLWYSDGTVPGTMPSFWLATLGIRGLEEFHDYLYFIDHNGPSTHGHADDPGDAYHLHRTALLPETLDPLRNIYWAPGDINNLVDLKAAHSRLFFSREAGPATFELYVYAPGTPSDDLVVTGFMLINADTNEEIMPINDGDIINLLALPTKNLNIRAITDPGHVGSVAFTKHGTQGYRRVENVAPYAFAGDDAGDYTSWTPRLAHYSITATPYSENFASGIRGMSLRVSFQVTEAIVGPMEVISFTLVNAETNNDIMNLNEGDVINLNELPTRNLNIRANTDPYEVGSVEFTLHGSNGYARIENRVPYSFAGDDEGDYGFWTPILGEHGITATPFASRHGEGNTGTPLSLSFVVIDDPVSGMRSRGYEMQAFQAFPNPFHDLVNLDLKLTKSAKVIMEIYDVSGVLISRIYSDYATQGQKIHAEFDAGHLRDGIYLLKVAIDGEVSMHRLVLAR
jgi:hypothetical protein